MSELLEIAERIAGWAKAGEQVEAFVSRDDETEVRAYQGEVESLVRAQSQGVGVRVVVEGRQGYAYAGTLDDQALHDTLQEARDNATFAEPDAFNGLGEPDGMPVPDLNLFAEELAGYSIDDKVALAIELERATRAADPRISGIESAEYIDSVYESAVATSGGLSATTRETGCYVSAYALAESGDETQTGFGFSIGRHPGELDPVVAAADAAERATRLLGASKPPSERLTVVLDPWVTAQFLGIVGHTLTGEAVLKGRSLFAGREGEMVAHPSITLVDDPTNPAAFTASLVDGEGLATRRTSLLVDGQLTGYLHNSYSGRRSGTASTGSAVRGGFKSGPGVGARALSLVPGTASQAELIAGIDNGFLVQGVAGLHSGVNPVSGDFSTGAEGLRIRNGELAEPIREVTIASTVQRLLLDVLAIGGDLEWLPMSAAGVTLVVADVTMSGA
jgi:PmbA protein